MSISCMFWSLWLFWAVAEITALQQNVHTKPAINHKVSKIEQRTHHSTKSKKADNLVMLEQQQQINHKVSKVAQRTHHPSNKSHKADNQSVILPEVISVMQKPHEILAQMGSQMSMLEEHMAEVQRQNAAAMAKQKREYESKLSDQHKGIHAIKVENAAIASEIGGLQKLNAQLRKEADSLLQRSNVLTTDLEALQGNITMAHEFTEKALVATDAMLNNATELSILAELSAEDAVKEKELVKAQRLQAIGKVSLVQFGAQIVNSHDLNAQDLLQSLLASLGDLSQEQRASEASLKDSFEQKFQEGSNMEKALLAEQAKMNITRLSERELHNKLAVAVNHLGKVNNELFKHSSSLRSFAQRIGALPMPQDGSSKLRAAPASSSNKFEVHVSNSTPALNSTGLITSSPNVTGSSALQKLENLTGAIMR